MKLIFFFLIATRLLNSSKWLPIQKKLVTIFKDKQNLFHAVDVLDRPSKIKLGKRSSMCYKVNTRMDDIQHSSWPKSKLASSHRLRKEVCHGFIFANLFNSLYLSVRLWWNVLVANLATNFQDLVAKVKNLVALAPVLGAISRPELLNILELVNLLHPNTLTSVCIFSILFSIQFLKCWKGEFVY